MSTGTTIFFDEHSGYGFLRPDEGGADIFIHKRDIMNSAPLRAGQKVSFEIVDDERRGKPRASNARII